jgi:hypothetical protein
MITFSFELGHFGRSETDELGEGDRRANGMR